MNYCEKHLKQCRLKRVVTDLRKQTADNVEELTKEWWAAHMETAIADGDAPDYDGDLVVTLR